MSVNHRSVFSAVMIATLLSPALSPAGPAGGRASDVTVEISGATMTRMASSWADYFGTHYANTPDEAGTTWNTVRSYGGTHVGIQAETPSAPPRRGPFSGREVRLSLDDFRGPRGTKSAAQLIPDLIEHGFDAMYIMTNIVRPGVEPFDRDRAYWAVRMIHEAFPEARRHVVWQIGNEVVSGHFDPKGVWKTREEGAEQKTARPGQREDNFFGYDLKWKEDYYVNDYLAPAIEAVERAAKDLHGDPRAIRVALGSMNPYNRQNVEFLRNVMERSFDSRQAPSLTGEPVWKHIDLLTVHYMAGSPGTIARLQQYLDEYLRPGKINGIWLTEDFGNAGKGPVTIVDRGLRFLDWAARNGLSADQTRLCWWGENARKPGGSGREATVLLGAFLSGRPLFFSHRQDGDVHMYALSDAADANLSRGMIAVVPERGGAAEIDAVTIRLPAGAAAKAWSARLVSYSVDAPPQIAGAKLSRDGTSLRFSGPLRGANAWLLMFAEDPSALPKAGNS